jgi:hypothetical protein
MILVTSFWIFIYFLIYFVGGKSYFNAEKLLKVKKHFGSGAWISGKPYMYAAIFFFFSLVCREPKSLMTTELSIEP